MRQKLGLNLALEQARALMAQQLEEEEEAKRMAEKEMSRVHAQLLEAKKKAEDEGEEVFRLEELGKKNAKDIEELQHRLEELQAANEKLEESNRKLASQLEDSNIELKELQAAYEKLDKSKRKLAAELEDSTREFDTMVLELESQQRNFDQALAEERMHSECIAQERDKAECDAREKETKLLNQTGEYDDTMWRLEEAEERSSDEFEFKPAAPAPVESRSHRLSIGAEIQQMNIPLAQTPLHDREFRRPPVDTSDASTQTPVRITSRRCCLLLLLLPLAIFVFNFGVSVEHKRYI